MTPERVRCSAWLGVTCWRSGACVCLGSAAAGKREAAARACLRLDSGRRMGLKRSEKPGCTQGSELPETENAALQERAKLPNDQTAAPGTGSELEMVQGAASRTGLERK